MIAHEFYKLGSSRLEGSVGLNPAGSTNIKKVIDMTDKQFDDRYDSESFDEEVHGDRYLEWYNTSALPNATPDKAIQVLAIMHTEIDNLRRLLADSLKMSRDMNDPDYEVDDSDEERARAVIHECFDDEPDFDLRMIIADYRAEAEE